MPYISYSDMHPTSACALFFRIPELVSSLARFLTLHDLTVLTQTSRHLHSSTIPLLWNHLDLQLDDRPQRLLSSPDALNALARNVRHVRWLKADTTFFSYYLDALSVYLEQQPSFYAASSSSSPSASQFKKSSTESSSSIASAVSSLSSTPTLHSRTFTLEGPAAKRPQWLSSTVLGISSVVPLPPLIHLTRVDCSFEMDIRHRQFFSSTSSSTLPTTVISKISNNNNMDHRGTALSTPQACWLISLSTRLTHLCLHGVELENELVVRVLCRTIIQLIHLKYLELSSHHNQEISIQVCRTIFLSCPTSLKSLIYSNMDIGDRPGLPVTELDLLSSQGDGWGQEALVLREEPLAHLKQLVLPGMRLGYRTDAIDWAVGQCPALEAFDVPCFADASVGDIISNILQERCPRLRHLSVRRPYLGYRGGGVMSVMEKIPEQQLETFYFKGYIDEWPLQLELALSRHTETLREIRFVLCRKMNSSTLKTILTSCKGLVHLEVQGAHLNSIYLSLEDGIESEWVCRNLEHLHIAINMGQDEDSSSSHKALGRSMAPTLTKENPVVDEDELVYWESLETFYRTLGFLTRLSVLNLKLLAFDSRDKELDYTCTTIPAFLTLGDRADHRPGFLPLLANLSNLRELRGSVRADTSESMTTMGQKEIEFMVEHWPRLELVEFLPTGRENKDFGLMEEEVIPPHLAWLKKQRPGIRLSLKPEAPSFAATF